MLTNEQRRRVVQALEETNSLIAREEKYMPHLQNQKLLADYRKHRAKLNGLLDGTVTLPPVFINKH